MKKPKFERKIFVSSTIADLKHERHFIKQYVEAFKPTTIKCLLSEYPDFPVHPDKIQKTTYEICLENLVECDYVIFLMKKNYGIPDIQYGNEFISIVHNEMRLAIKKQKPLWAFIHKDLWVAYNGFKSSPHKTVHDTQRRQFSMLHELEKSFVKRNRWLNRYSKLKDIEDVIHTSILNYDDSAFVANTSIPAGATFGFNEKFIKTWEIRNIGMKVWENRFLKEINPGNGLIPSQPIVPIKKTLPGESVQISVELTTPCYETMVESRWKMIYENGEFCFPHRTGIFCLVNVVL